jgi:hypothetical protein
MTCGALQKGNATPFFSFCKSLLGKNNSQTWEFHKPIMMESFYDLLEIKESSSHEEIKKAIAEKKLFYSQKMQQ